MRKAKPPKLFYLLLMLSVFGIGALVYFSSPSLPKNPPTAATEKSSKQNNPLQPSPLFAPKVIPHKTSEQKAALPVRTAINDKPSGRNEDDAVLSKQTLRPAVKNLHKNQIKQSPQKHQRNTAFEKIDFHGNTLPSDASYWECARDIKTSLLWEIKLFDSGVSDAEHTYSWRNPNGQTGLTTTHATDQATDQATTLTTTPKPNPQGKCYDRICDIETYIKTINDMNLCGSSNWRLPSFAELETLIDRNYFSPTINQAIFPNTQANSYWTATTLEHDATLAMQISFFNGSSSPAPKRIPYSLRLISE